jgi:hypothetical protein
VIVYGLVTLVLLVYAVVDLTRTPGAQVRTLPKPLWYLVLVGLPLLGAVAWLLAGRPRRGGAAEAPTPPVRPIAPDDDEDFLRELRRRSRDPRDDAA